MECVFCNAELADSSHRSAYDPWIGRLWRICGSCGRWNVVPLEDRWEALESFERAVRDRGRSILRTEHLDLVAVDRAELVRVGRAPRPELAGWRYGDALPPARVRGAMAWIRRLLLALPTSPLGYGAGYGDTMADTGLAARWFASPFLDDALTLTGVFLHVPLAPACPACGGPLALEPWSFQDIRVVPDGGAAAVVCRCGACGAEVGVGVRSARPALRLGLGLVNRRASGGSRVEAAARLVDRAEGPDGLLRRLAADSPAVGELSVEHRLALGFALDEQEEAELLEAEWREAEELAAITDGPLTEPASFVAFRHRVLSGD